MRKDPGLQRRLNPSEENQQKVLQRSTSNTQIQSDASHSLVHILMIKVGGQKFVDTRN